MNRTKSSDWLLVLQSNKTLERFLNITLLLIVTLVIQIIYAIYVRPAAEEFMIEQQALVNADPNYDPPRSILVIIAEPEPEASIIVTVWALCLALIRVTGIKRDRSVLEEDVLQLQPGSIILPDDTRDHLRRFDQMPR